LHAHPRGLCRVHPGMYTQAQTDLRQVVSSLDLVAASRSAHLLILIQGSPVVFLVFHLIPLLALTAVSP
jgi:hypothetical protein